MTKSQYKKQASQDEKALNRFIRRGMSFEHIAMFFKNRHEGVANRSFTLDSDIMVTHNKQGKIIYV